MIGLLLFQTLIFLVNPSDCLIPTSLADALPDSNFTSPESEDVSQLRDPFKKPILQYKKKVMKTPLEKFASESFKLVGVMTGPERLRAMLMAPDGKSYFVAEKTRIGVNNGVILRITPDKVMVREKVKNELGAKENVDIEIRFGGNSSENRSQF